MRQATALLAFAGHLFVASSVLAAPAPRPAVAADAEVAKGIRQVDDGEFDLAILTLDAATRRLVGKPGQSKDLSQAYLYLGIAYLGKGHETSARARFREALGQVKDLNLSPEKFAPRVIEVFEKAKEESAKPGSAAAANQGGGSGGSKKWLWIGGGVAVAGAGAALALSGGEEEFDPNTTEFRDGFLTTVGVAQSISLGPGAAGAWKAELSWASAASEVALGVYDSSGRLVSSARLVTPTSSIAEFTGEAGATYRFEIGLKSGAATTFELSVEFPKP